jgi:dTDP-4-dehydrorhamnose reductase
LQGELLLRQINPPDWLIIRTSWLFGATGPCFPRTIVDRAQKGLPLKIVNDQIGSPTYAPDLACAAIELMEKGVTGIHHLTNSGQCSWFEFARAILAEFKIDTDIQPIATAAFRQMRPSQAVRPAFSVLEDRELSIILGRGMRPWNQTLVGYRGACSNSL